MSKRVCRKCNIEKDYKFSHLNAQARAVFLDDRNLPWNGRECSQCKSGANKGNYVKRPPKTYHKVCKHCDEAYISSNVHTKYCQKPQCQASKPKLDSLIEAKERAKARKTQEDSEPTE